MGNKSFIDASFNSKTRNTQPDVRGDLDRRALQALLMPFTQWLPPHLRGPNARLGEHS